MNLSQVFQFRIQKNDVRCEINFHILKLISCTGYMYSKQVSRMNISFLLNVIYFVFKESLQPKISYKAVPYPIVTNTTNITLTCTGRTVDYVTVPHYQSYMSKVEIRKNNKVIRSCRRSIRLHPTRNMSCEVSVWGVNDNDKFMCLMYASKAPCNGARLSFEVQSKWFHRKF